MFLSCMYVCVCFCMCDFLNLIEFSLFHLQLRVPYRPTESKLSVLPSNRDKLPSGKQIMALKLTWVIVFSFLFILPLY